MRMDVQGLTFFMMLAIIAASVNGFAQSWKPLDFGRVPIGSSKDTTIVILNNSSSDTLGVGGSMRNVNIWPNDAFSIVTPLDKPFFVSPGQSLSMTFRFAPMHSQEITAYFWALPYKIPTGFADSIKFLLIGNGDDPSMRKIGGRITDNAGIPVPGIHIFCHELDANGDSISTKISAGSDSSGYWSILLPANRAYSFQMKADVFPSSWDSLFDNRLYADQWFDRTDNLGAQKVLIQSDRNDIDFVLSRLEYTVLTGIVDAENPQGYVCVYSRVPLEFTVESTTSSYVNKRWFKPNPSNASHYRYSIAVPKGDTYIIWTEGMVREMIRGTTFDSSKMQFYKQQPDKSTATQIVADRYVIDDIDFNFLGTFKTATIIINLVNLPTNQGYSVEFLQFKTAKRNYHCPVSYKNFDYSAPGTVALECHAGEDLSINANLWLRKDNPLKKILYDAWYSTNGIDTSVVNLTPGDTLWITLDFNNTPFTNPSRSGLLQGRIASMKTNNPEGNGGADIVIIDRETMTETARLQAINGGFKVHLEEGKYLVYAVGGEDEAPVFLGGEIDWQKSPLLNISKQTTLDVALSVPVIKSANKDNTVISGTVKSQNVPLTDAFVYAFVCKNGFVGQASYDKTAPIAFTRTDENGEFTIQDLAFDKYVIVITKLGYGTQEIIRELSSSEPTADISTDLGNHVLATVRESTTPGFALEQNYPNPAFSSANITFSIPQMEQVKISVFNLLGQEVRHVVDAPFPSGVHSVAVNVSDLPSGVYTYVMTVRGARRVRLMSVVK